MSAKATTASVGPRVSVSRNMLTSLIGNLFPPLAALISGPILAHALGVQGRGEVAAATAPLALVVTIATFGIPEALTYTVARRPGLVRAASGHGLLILGTAGVFATAAVILGRDWLSGGNPHVAQLSVFAALVIVPNLLVAVIRGTAAASQKWRLVATERILASSGRLVILLPLWLAHDLTPLTATIVIAVMPVMGALAYLRLPRHFQERIADVDREATARRLMAYGLRIWIGSISGILLSRIDQTLMTPLADTYQLGLYVVAVSISELPLIVNSAVRDVSFASDAQDRADDRLAASARISSTICAAAALFLGVSMIWWVPFLFGDAFRPSIPVAAVLLAAVALGTPGSVGGSGLGARGRPGLRSMSLIVACLVNIALLIVLLPHLGAMGAAIATLAGNLISSNLNLIFMQRHFGIRFWRFYGLRRSDIGVFGGAMKKVVKHS